MAYAAYEYYKPSGITTIGLIPHHWTVRRLKFMARIQNGKDYKEVVSEDGFPVIGSGGEFAKASVYLYNGESVLLGRKGTIDRPRYINGPFWTVDTMFYTEVAADVSAKYLYYCALTINFLKYATSTALPSMTQQDLGAIPFALPKHDEQQAIARFLDFKTAQIDALIAKKKELLDKLTEKRTALISHAVTKGLDPSVSMKDSGVTWLGEVPSHWTIIRARYASTFVTSGSRGWAEYYSDLGSVFLRITNVSRDSVDLLLHDIQRVSPPESSEGERTATQSGDVLVSITADLGSVAVIPNGFESAYVSQHLALVRPNGDRALGRWMAYQFSSASGQAQLTGSGYGGTKIQLGLGDVKDVWLALPPTGEQEEILTWIGAEVERLKRQSDSIQDVIFRLREYRSALITNAVTGKIDVRHFEIPLSAEGIAS